MNKTISYQNGGKLDWETNEFKLTPIVTRNGAIAPEPIQLTTDACFSTPMLSMGRRRVTGVKWLREVSRGAPKANKARIDYIIVLYEIGEIAKVSTAENIAERLTSKKHKRFTRTKPIEFTTNWLSPHRTEKPLI